MRLRRKIANFLMKKCGLRRLYRGRASKLMRSILDEIDLQHVRDSNPCESCDGREAMYDYVNKFFVEEEAIDYLEFGVYRGESISYWAGLNRHKHSRFFGFDSFEGLPEDWHPDKPKGHFQVEGFAPQIDDSRVKFIKGWFEDTIPPFAREFSVQNRLLLHIDADLYGSAMLALVYLAPFMSRGTLIIFDEFYDREHEAKALRDFQAIYKNSCRIIANVANYAKICVEML